MRIIRCLQAAGVVFLVLCSSLMAYAQTGTGTVTGTAKDTAGATLQGALVELLPSGKRAVTDGQGQFRITDVPRSRFLMSDSKFRTNK